MSYARKAVTRMTLDMSRVDLQRSETVTLLDTNRRWEVTLTNGGTPFRLPNNWTASLVGVKPDENGLMLSCSVVDGSIIFDFAENEQLTTCAGAFPLVFDVWNEYGELVASPKIWLHVLPDVRPHEDLKSTGQYTTIGDLIDAEKANREDIDENTEGVKANAADIEEINALLYGYREGEPAEGEEPGAVLASVQDVDEKTEANKRSIEALTENTNEKFDHLQSLTPSFGTLTIPTSEWPDRQTVLATVHLPESTLRPGALVVVVPANDATKKVVAEQGMSIKVDAVTEASNAVTFERLEGKVPEIDLVFRYAVIYTESDEDPTATLVGGLGGGGENGIYIGSDYPPPSATIWIDPTGEPSATEPWEFDMEAGGTTTKRVVVLETITGGGN